MPKDTICSRRDKIALRFFEQNPQGLTLTELQAYLTENGSLKKDAKCSQIATLECLRRLSGKDLILKSKNGKGWSLKPKETIVACVEKMVTILVTGPDRQIVALPNQVRITHTEAVTVINENCQIDIKPILTEITFGGVKISVTGLGRDITSRGGRVVAAKTDAVEISSNCYEIHNGLDRTEIVLNPS